MPKKIFELAKELDMGAIDLVESLKQKGFAVKNHMQSLTDEEVEKVMASFKEDQPAKKSAKKKTKKKTAKKKVTKKKVVKKVSKKDTESSEEKLEAKTDKKVEETKNEEETTEAVEVEAKSKTVVRKKKSSKNSDSESSDSSSSTGTEKKKFGLRVVAGPSEEDLRRVEEEKEERARQEELRAKTPADDDSSSISDEDSKDKSKKRLGGLASMMSGKKSVVNKAETINQQRSENELKSYALGSLGKPIYTQVKRKKIYTGSTKNTEITEVKDSKRVIKLHDGGTAATIAKKLKIKFKDMADECLSLNLLMHPDDFIGMKLASQIASLYDYKVENVAFDEEEVIGKEKLTDEAKSKLPLRNPIITIMGHVDHGKTTLLDYIRKAKVASGEAGGITQHIGAYSVKVKNQTLTFLDTPGHAAFASMRQRGADVTDIVILVVAADDGVMPQTKESVRFCQKADKPMIIAVNKMDKDGANPDRIKTELTEFQITPEEWGGETQYVNISALNGDNVDALLESIALQAEMMELRADAKGSPEGVVIESKIEQGRGAVATILIQSGTLKKGDSLVVGETFGRARNLMDSFGKQLNSAGPSTPVQILGLSEAPSPGDVLNVVKNEREAKKIVQNRIDERKKLEAGPAKPKMSLEDFFANAAEDVSEKKTLNLIVRSDVQGSFEAIKQSLEPLSTNNVEVKIISGGVGPISDSDVQLAESAQAFIMGFNMRPLTTARKLAEDKGVDVKTYSIIYELINDVKLAIEGLLEPEFNEKYIGRADVKDTFSVPKAGVIAGSVVVDGKIMVGCNVRLLRNGQIMFDGKMSSLKRFKDDVKEVKSGVECGIGLEGFNNIKVDDTFECYIMEEKKLSYDDVAKQEAKEAEERLKKEAQEAKEAEKRAQEEADSENQPSM